MIGTKLAQYEITSHLGTGGMGEVYQATDTKLKRDVAIKILPQGFTQNADRVNRFQREAEVLASLNHPGIASIYDLQESNNTRYLVLELVEGETLADRIQRGAIPIDESLQIAKGICEAVESAHDKGVVHRDLKPANIKLTPEGQVKVLDFGLAKVFTDSKTVDLANSPTLVSVSMPGTILGTAAYMSPEQAKGRDADRASDVWAFGCVLYEMLTGHAAFEGETVGEILAGVFKTEPAWDRLPADTPENIRRLLRRCLEKDRARRPKSLDPARIEIDDALNSTPVPREASAAAAPTGRGKWIAVCAFIAVVMLGGGLWIGRRSQPQSEPGPLMRFELPLPPGESSLPEQFGALSPDGRYFVTTLSNEGRRQLWLYRLDSTIPKMLPGTAGASNPFWSPTSESVGFFADGQLKRIDIDGGQLRSLADAPENRGGAWNENGIILFAASAGTPISRISANGGTPTLVTTLSKSGQDVAHRYPTFLPDNKHFLYNVNAGQEQFGGVFIGDIDDPSFRIRLLPAATPVHYAKPGYLLYIAESNLYARTLDMKTLAFAGDPSAIQTGVYSRPGTGAGAFSVSQTGVVAYKTGTLESVLPQRQLLVYERSSKTLRNIGEPGPYSSIGLSSDAKTILVEKADLQAGTADLWLMDLARAVPSRWTTHPLWDQHPVWSADGSEAVFFSNRAGPGDLYRKRVGGGDETLLYKSELRVWPTDWSDDGKLVMFEGRDTHNQWDLLTVPASGNAKPEPFVATRFNERQGKFSPDGKWVAYSSDESGHYEIYIESFPRGGARTQVSTKSGSEPQWRQDGKEIYFLQEGKISAADVNVAGNRLTVSEPHAVVDGVTLPQSVFNPNASAEYAASRDGKLFFLLLSSKQEKQSSPTTLILNWPAALKKTDR